MTIVLPSEQRAALRELALLFLRLGATAFGGPAAHVAMMEDEVVRRRRWLTPEEFLDLLGATNLIPGPELDRAGDPRRPPPRRFRRARRRRRRFILPAALIVTGVAWLYVRFGALPAVEGVLRGVKPVVVAVVAQALWRFGRTAIRTDRSRAALAAAAAAAAALGVHELAVLGAAGAALAVGAPLRPRPGRSRRPRAPADRAPPSPSPRPPRRSRSPACSSSS